MQKIVVSLRGERGLLCGRGAESLASEVLSYVRQRNVLWLKQDSQHANGGGAAAAATAKQRGRGGSGCDFDRDNLPYLEEEATTDHKK